MNKRIKKKTEKRKRKIIHEIFDKVIVINGLQASRKKDTGNHPTVFFDFSGHIGKIEVRVFSSGWEPYADADKEVKAYVDDHKGLRQAIDRLKE